MFGQSLGLAISQISLPSHMHPDLFESQRIVMLAASEHFVLALSVCGTLWSCGNRQLLFDEFSYAGNYEGGEPELSAAETEEYEMPDVAEHDVEMFDHNIDTPQSTMPQVLLDTVMHEESNIPIIENDESDSSISKDDDFYADTHTLVSPAPFDATVHAIPQKISRAFFNDAPLVFIAASRSNFAAVTAIGKLYVCNLLHNMPHQGIPMIFHPWSYSDARQHMHPGALSAQQYFGGARVSTQYRMSTENGVQYALGHFQNNLDFHKRAMYTQMLRTRQARIRDTKHAADLSPHSTY